MIEIPRRRYLRARITLIVSYFILYFGSEVEVFIVMAALGVLGSFILMMSRAPMKKVRELESSYNKELTLDSSAATVVYILFSLISFVIVYMLSTSNIDGILFYLAILFSVFFVFIALCAMNLKRSILSKIS